jgi:hypothetical protein
MSARQEDFEKYRKDYPVFIYHAYQIRREHDALRLEFHFEIPGLCEFRPCAEFPSRSFINNPVSECDLNHLAFHIGMAEVVSYWKACCCPRVEVRCNTLSRDQILWWKKLYYHGLGEFFYLNGIATGEDSFMDIECSARQGTAMIEAFHPQRILVPVGGGKDSVVSMELLRKAGKSFMPLIMNPRGATVETARIAGFSENESLYIKRSIDPALLDLNARGFLNGHTPFSAMLAFYALLAARISGAGDLVLSNEASANEATIPGTRINHQYSKSLEFENDFRSYVNAYISNEINYYSLLRPLQELQIASIFSKNPAYFSEFKSCNAGSKTNSWCGKCAKCLFAYIILSPFIDRQTLAGIFGHDFLDDPGLEAYFDELCGMSVIKPFECIGTLEEVNMAMQMFILKNEARPCLVRHYQQRSKWPEISPGEMDAFMHKTEAEHHVDSALLNIIHEYLHD